MSVESIGRVLPGSVRQNGYVVRNLERAIESWLALGVAPWLVMRGVRQPGGRYRGAPSEPALSIAFANSGELQIELIQPEDGTPSIYREFLDAGREGFHHLAWWAEDFDGALARATAAGWNIAQASAADAGARFAYFEVGARDPMIVEVMELNAVTRALTDAVRSAAADWDGSGSAIRPIG